MKTLALLSVWLALPVMLLASGTSAAGAAHSLTNDSSGPLLLLMISVAYLLLRNNIKAKWCRVLFGVVTLVAIAFVATVPMWALAGGGPCSACNHVSVPQEVKVVGGFLIFWISGLLIIGL